MEQASRVIEMIHHFRTLSVNRAAQENESKASVAHAVHEVLHAMQYEFPLSHITVLKILPHDLPLLPVTREHLETILFQLIYNARQRIGHKNGIITVEAAEKIYLSPENPNRRRFLIRVCDTGPVIAEQHLENIFDPFFASKEKVFGGGLGLYIVKKLTEYHRGSMRVETSVRSTSFYMEIPE